MRLPPTALASALVALAALAAPAIAGAQATAQAPAAAAADPVATPAPGAPPPPAAAPAAFARRDALECSDFKRAEAGGWSVLAAVELPAPQGPLRLSPGQAIAPGDYLGGWQLAAVLQARCPP